MDMDIFAKKVRDVIRKEMGDGYVVQVNEVVKNNGVILHGLSVRRFEYNIAATIYLDDFLEAYEAGAMFESIAESILDACRKGLENEPSIGFFQSFDKVRDRICYRLISIKGNEELLKAIPYIEFLDLAICFYYAYQDKELGDGTILIYNSHMELWDTCTAELFGVAKRNTQKLFPWACSSLAEVMDEIGAEDADWRTSAEKDVFLRKMPLWVLSNEKRTYGAACILYPGVLAGIAENIGDFFIIPSSVHEVIILPDTGNELPEGLKEMVRCVNDMEVKRQEILSYSLYRYDSGKGLVEKI